MTTLRSFAARALVLSLGFSLVFAPYTAPKAHAQLATFESNPAVVIALGQIAGAQTLERAKEDLLDGIAWTVAKVAVQSMTRSIVTWINSGYQGSPAFSQNLTRDLRQAGDAIAGAFISDFFSANIESPFLSLARDAVSVYYLMSSGDALAARLKNSLANYTYDSVAYMRGDWKSGGLSGWYGLSFRCENDPTCASFLVQENLINKIDAQFQKSLAEFGAGRGFLSWRGDTCSQTAGGQAGNAAFQQCVAQNEAGGPQQDCFSLYEEAGASLSDANECVAYEIETPGSVVESALADTFGSPIRQLELADSINEIVGAVVTQMVTQVLGGGGLAGLSKPRASGSGTPLTQATNPGTTGVTMGAGFESSIRTERTKAVSYQLKWTEIREVALRAKDACPVAGGLFSLTRASAIDDAVKRADAALERANTAVTELDAVLATLQELEASPDSNQLVATQQAYNAFQQLLANGVLINQTEQTEAAFERDETKSDSLFSKMTGYANDCN